MKSTRRKFLNLGIWSSLSAICGWKIGKKIKQTTTGKKVRMMTSDGKVVEIEEKFLPDKQKGMPVTNEQLNNWIDSGAGTI